MNLYILNLYLESLYLHNLFSKWSSMMKIQKPYFIETFATISPYFRHIPKICTYDINNPIPDLSLSILWKSFVMNSFASSFCISFNCFFSMMPSILSFWRPKIWLNDFNSTKYFIFSFICIFILRVLFITPKKRLCSYWLTKNHG